MGNSCPILIVNTAEEWRKQFTRKLRYDYRHNSKNPIAYYTLCSIFKYFPVRRVLQKQKWLVNSRARNNVIRLFNSNLAVVAEIDEKVYFDTVIFATLLENPIGWTFLNNRDTKKTQDSQSRHTEMNAKYCYFKVLFKSVYAYTRYGDVNN